MADSKIKYDIEANVTGEADINDFAQKLEDVAKVLGSDLSPAAKAAAVEMRALGQQQAAIVAFAQLSEQVKSSERELSLAQRSAKSFVAEISASGPPTAQQAETLTRLNAQIQSSETKLTGQKEALHGANQELLKYGLTGDRLIEAQRQTAASVDALKTSVQASIPAFKAVSTEGTTSAHQIQAAWSTLGVKSFTQTQIEIEKVNAALEKVKATSKSPLEIKIATEAAKTQIKNLEGGVRNLGTASDSVSTQLNEARNSLLAFVGVQGVAGTVKDVAALADQWGHMKSRLQLALGAQVDINKAMADVEGVSKRTYTSLDSTANLYGKIAAAGRDMGVSQQQALAITETINKSIQLSGASAQASEAAITQLIQGLQSGVVRGDEFNSIMEQSPRLAKAMADGIGVPVGALRGLAEQGKLTSQTVINALQTQSQAIGDEFKTLPLTIGRAVQSVQTEWKKFIGTMDASTGASAGAAAGIEVIAKHLDDLARLAAETGAALTAAFAIQAVQGLRAAAAQMAVTGGAAALLRRDLDTLNKPVQIAIAVTGFEAGYQLGSWLRENMVWARQLGVVMTEMGATIVNDLQFIEEATAALFTKDTIGKAVDRYWERSQKLTSISREMFADAEKAPAKVGEATDAASVKVTSLGTTAQDVGSKIAHAATQGAAGVAGIGAAANDARTALEKLAGVINAPKPVDNGINAIVKDLIAATNRGQDLNQILSTQLPDAIDKLSGPELVKFRSEFVSAMDAAKQALKDAIDTDKPRAEIDALQAKVDSFEKSTRTGLGLIAEQAAKNLGVDVPLAFNKMSTEFIGAQNNISVLIRSLPELKAAGIDTGLAIAQAMSKMIDGAKNQAELEAVRQRIGTLKKELGDKITDGLLDQAKQKALELKDALDKATPGIGGVREAMKQLGVVSDQTFKDTATQSKAAYDAMKTSGTNSARELADGFKKYASDAIAANNGVATETIKSEAAMRGLEIATDSAGKAIVQSMGAGAKATESQGKAIIEATGYMDVFARAALKATAALESKNAAVERGISAQEKANDLTQRAIDLENKRRNVDKEGFSLNTAGQRVAVQNDTQRSVYENAKGQGLTEAQALQISNQFMQNGQKTGYGGANVAAGENWGTELQKAIDKAVLANASNGSVSGTPGTPGTTAATTTNHTYTVKVPIDGKTSSIGVTSEAAAQELISILQRAKLSAGY